MEKSEDFKKLTVPEKIDLIYESVTELHAQVDPLSMLYNKSVTYAKVISGLIGVVVFLAGIGESIFWIVRILKGFK